MIVIEVDTYKGMEVDIEIARDRVVMTGNCLPPSLQGIAFKRPPFNQKPDPKAARAAKVA